MGIAIPVRYHRPSCLSLVGHVSHFPEIPNLENPDGCQNLISMSWFFYEE